MSVLTTDLEVIEELEPSKTYKLLDTAIQGFTDELRALEQAIYKVLSTERYECPIYSFNYGIELEDLIGKDPVYVSIELKRRIRECLIQDERIQSIDSFVVSNKGDEMLCTFNVASIYGNITIEKEVMV